MSRPRNQPGNPTRRQAKFDAMVQLEELLENGPSTSKKLSEALGLQRDAVNNYLRQLMRDSVVRRGDKIVTEGEVDQVWMLYSSGPRQASFLGADVEAKRDWLVAALFGAKETAKP